jgi:hypothetical protein
MAYFRESDLPAFALDIAPADFSAAIVELGGTPPLNAINIVHRSQLLGGQVVVQVQWALSGLIANLGMWNPSCFFALRLYMEQMGPGEGPGVPNPPNVLVVQGPPLISGPYNHGPINIPIPPNTPVGVYRLTLTLNFFNPLGTNSIFHAYEDFSPRLLEVVQN